MDLLGATLGWFADPLHWQGANGIPARLGEHVAISAVSLLIAFVIAFPVGAWIGHTGRWTGLAINAANLWRALPSLAVIAMVLPVTAALDPQAGFKLYPTVVAMVVLALPPILVNTYTGLAGVERELLEAGRGQGMSEGQLFRRLELPLAVGVIVTGVRSGAVQVVATATLGAIFGFGGLGRYLVDGIAQRDAGQVFGGVILVAGVVIVTEALFALLQRAVTPRALLRPRRSGARAAA
jgi:osmoprotectant transport system permease protein